MITGARRPCRRGLPPRLVVELLEDRQLLTTMSPTSAAAPQPAGPGIGINYASSPSKVISSPTDAANEYAQSSSSAKTSNASPAVAIGNNAPSTRTDASSSSTEDQEYAKVNVTPVQVSQAVNANSTEALRRPAQQAPQPLPSSQQPAVQRDATPEVSPGPSPNNTSSPPIHMTASSKMLETGDPMLMKAIAPRFQAPPVPRSSLVEVRKERVPPGEEAESTPPLVARIGLLGQSLNLEHLERALDNFFTHMKELETLVAGRELIGQLAPWVAAAAAIAVLVEWRSRPQPPILAALPVGGARALPVPRSGAPFSG